MFYSHVFILIFMSLNEFFVDWADLGQYSIVNCSSLRTIKKNYFAKMWFDSVLKLTVSYILMSRPEN